MSGADLHLHSHFSDGEWPPVRLVRAALQSDLRAIALTDHDTLAGLPEAFGAAEDVGLDVIAGVEISTWMDGDLHLLAYGFDRAHAGLTAMLDRSREARYDRAVRMVERLDELGMPLALQAVLDEAGPGAIGRPHVARALVAAGHAASLREAFDRWLGDGKPACIEKIRVEPADAIDLVHRAGGVVVVAHPGILGEPGRMDPLVGAGLDGVEVMHTLHGASQIDAFADYADANGLVKTGGSDFHGPRPYLEIGSVAIPDEWLEELEARIDERRREAAAVDS